MALSLVVVWLTWCLAGALADGAKLSSTARRWFMTVAALLATLPPLYDVVMELRTWGGHIEIYILMLLLLYTVLRLTQRWDMGPRAGNGCALGWDWFYCWDWALDLSLNCLNRTNDACLDRDSFS